MLAFLQYKLTLKFIKIVYQIYSKYQFKPWLHFQENLINFNFQFELEIPYHICSDTECQEK